jgi:hypothetical protein
MPNTLGRTKGNPMRFRLAAVLCLLALLAAAGCQAKSGARSLPSRVGNASQAVSVVETGSVDGAWPVAKAAATKIAMGQSPGDGIASDRDYFDRLHHPSEPAYVRVWTPREDNFIRNDDGSLQVNFIVQNLHDESIPMVAYSVTLRSTAGGWKVDGFGHAP